MWAAAFSLTDLQTALGAVFGLTLVRTGRLLASLGIHQGPARGKPMRPAFLDRRPAFRTVSPD